MIRFVTSTFLTLPYRGLLESSQVLEAKMFLTCEMKHASNYDDDEHDGNNDHNDQSMPVMETEPPKKRFKHLSRVSIILEEKESNEDSRAGVNLTAEDLEIENYSSTNLAEMISVQTLSPFGLTKKLFFPTWH